MAEFDFVENLKKGAEKAFDSAETVTKAAIKKTSESVNTLKLKYAIKDIENNMDSVYKELGKMLYNEYENGAEFEGEYKEKCEKIKGFLSEIDVLRAKIAEISNKQICPNCGKSNEIDAKFCSGCGEEMGE